MDIDLVKEQRWRPIDLVSWLLDADMYFIISHLHQGLLDILLWNMNDLKSQLKLLYNGTGFPSRDNLYCPVFLQDKYVYLNALADNCNPTLRIDFLDYKSLPLHNTQQAVESFTEMRRVSITRYSVIYVHLCNHLSSSLSLVSWKSITNIRDGLSNPRSLQTVISGSSAMTLIVSSKQLCMRKLDFAGR